MGPVVTHFNKTRTVQIASDEASLQAVDDAAGEAGVHRSAFVRQAIRSYLAELRNERLEGLDWEGYRRIPDDPQEARDWEQEAAWPPD